MIFEPQNQNQFIGNDNPNSPLFYLDEWQSDSPQRLLFSGAPGLGKTTAAYLIAKHLNLDVVEFNASDERGIDAVRNKIREVAYSSSLWSARLILLDEFEVMAFMPGEGVLDDYSLVLANCVMSEQSMTPESCEEGVYSVVLSSIVMDGNSTSQPGVMFIDTDASGTLSSGDMIIIDHSQLNLTEEWNTPRLHSAEANAYADENPMMPGFTGILATLGLLGAALSRRE